jgi:predicted RND superfamily exporter protein
MLADGVYKLQYLIVLVLAVGAFAVEVWALVDALRQSSNAFPAAGKLTKPLWLIILGVAAALGFLALPFNGGGAISSLGFLSIIGVVAAAVYLTDVRPAVRQMRGRGNGSRGGPYGPW